MIAIALAALLPPAATAPRIVRRRVARPILCADNAPTDWDAAWRRELAARQEAVRPTSDAGPSLFRFATEEDAAKESERQLHLRQRRDFFLGLQRLTAFALSASVTTWVLLLFVYLPGCAIYSSMAGLPGLGSMDKATFARSVLLPGGEACAAVAITSVLAYSSVAGSFTADAALDAPGDAAPATRPASIGS